MAFQRIISISDRLSDPYEHFTESPLILPSTIFNGLFHLTLIGKLDGSIIVHEHSTDVRFTLRIRFTSVKYLGFDSHYKIILCLYNDCIVTVPLKTFKLIVAEILTGKGCLSGDVDLTVDLSVVVHYNPSYVNDPSTVQCIYRSTGFFDFIVENSISLSCDRYDPATMLQSAYFAVDTNVPYISFFQSFSRRSLSVMPKGYHQVKEKMKDIASQLGSRTRPFWTESENGPCYVWPGNPNWTLKKLYSLADMSRGALRGTFSVSSDHRFGAITDDQSRITLVDLHRGVALRFWKGCKEAQTCFVDVSERFPPAGRLPRTAKFILIHLPRSNNLEVWSLVHGPLLKCWSTNGSLRFLLPHMGALSRSLKHFNALCVVGNEHLVGIRLNLDLWFPHTPEAGDFETFSRLRGWICSRAFKASLKSNFAASITKLEGLLGDFTLPDWFLKAVWILLRTELIDLSTWVAEKLVDLGNSFPFEEPKKHAFQKHLEKICSLIHFYHSLSRMHKAQMAHFFPVCGKATNLPKFLQPWTFFRAAAHSRLFWISFDKRHQDKTAAHETLLGQAIFTAFFWGAISAESFIKFLNDAPFTYDYLLVLATRFLVTQSTLPPQVSPSRLTQLTQTLFSSRPHHLSAAFVRIYSVMLASHNYASCLVVCAALVGAGEAEQQLADQQPRGSDKNVEDGPEKTAAPDVLQSSLESLRCRIKHLQDMVIFNRCLASFRRGYNLPRWTPRAYSVRHVFQRGSDHFTSEFARCLAGSQLKGSEVLAIYRGFVAETATNEFWDEDLPFTPPAWTRVIVPLSPPPLAKRLPLRRAFLDWLLQSSARRSDQRLDSHRFRSRLSAVAMHLAVAWGLPPGLIHALHVVALYTAWSDREAEAELVSSSFSSTPFSVGNAGASLFHLLASRICFLDEQMSGRLLTDASKSLRAVLACLWEKGSSGVDAVSREDAPSMAEQMLSARRLVDFLVEHLPQQSNQHAMAMEIGELLHTIDQLPQ
ncbi:Rab3 GTPase-activating protein non-catalytic subunit [Echinococcus granulosus]|uniref:Rab3 GTPase-activating protein non-catalytic subunit n=1 Tax=Echinococcus granulosus TaxID=6210 RepID=W6USE3_ECHGR|nr:Rab3 GTPase-activating protein non-catalytic subunit [Echinococcus granulosus]EUB61287.1 Rab3 GTPase-activating protein non-catalytic subunit [Echinococcus granulosus]